MMEQNWGLVFSGGGAKGAYQIGVWKALKERNMEGWIGGISGASIGSLNAALFACNEYAQAEAVWKQVNMLSVFDTDWALIDGKEGIFSREAMLYLIRGYVDMKKITESRRPIFCSVSKVISEQAYEGCYMRLDGRTSYVIETLLMASSALPVIHEAVEYQGSLYRDGGLTDNVPIKPLYELGFRKIILVGLKEEMKRFEQQYPDVEFLSVYPSQSLGNFLDGTLNFRQRFIQFGMKLGYKDGLRVFQAYQSGEIDDARLKKQAELDYQEILMEMKQMELKEQVDGHMETLKQIMETYGID